MVHERSINQFIFGDFVNSILTDLENHPVPDGFDNNRCIIWDNLNVHKTEYVTHLIRDRPTQNHFFSVDRPPYRPNIAPIEYIFCEVLLELAGRCKRSWTIDTLRNNI